MPAGDPGPPSDRIGPLNWRRSRERAAGALRLGAAAYGAALMVLREPDLGEAATAAMWVVLTLTAALGVIALGTIQQLGRSDLERFARVTFGLDAVLLSLPSLLLGAEEIPLTGALLLVLLVIGAFKFALTGALLAIGVVAVAEVARQILRVTVWQVDPTWEIAALSFGLAVVLGVALGWLARDAEARREVSERETRRATLLAEQSAATSREVTAMQRVVVAGIASVEIDALDRMVHEVALQLDLPGVSLIVVGDAGPVLAASTIPGAAVGEVVAPRPHGPVASALESGRSQLADADTADRLGGSDPVVQVAAPFHAKTGTSGALVVQSGDTTALGTEQLGMLKRLADQMGLVIEAARAFEKEAALVEEYRQLDEMKTDFVAITSHELRTPLTAVLGFAETLLRPELDLSEQQTGQLLGSLLSQARRLAHLVDDLQTVSHLDRGKLKVQPRDVALAEVVTTVRDESPHASRIRTAGPDLAVHADPNRLRQVIANLVSNAFDHGGSEVEVSWRLVDGTVLLTVADNGPGIAPEHQERIFDRFFQVEDTMAHQRGSGLGLPIATGLMAAMGGELWLEDIDAPGARFTISLVPARSASLSRH